MRYEVDEFLSNYLMLVCLLKVYHDAGNFKLEKEVSNYPLNDYDYYYQIVIDAIECAAPIVIKENDNLYRKYGESEDDSNIYAYSSKELQKYLKLARKLYRLEGAGKNSNPYIDELWNKMHAIRGFRSYSFDCHFGNLRRAPQLEVIWWFEFDCELAMCLWVVRLMSLVKEELPKIQKKYRKVRRQKRIERNIMKKGGKAYATC